MSRDIYWTMSNLIDFVTEKISKFNPQVYEIGAPFCYTMILGADTNAGTSNIHFVIFVAVQDLHVCFVLFACDLFTGSLLNAYPKISYFIKAYVPSFFFFLLHFLTAKININLIRYINNIDNPQYVNQNVIVCLSVCNL